MAAPTSALDSATGGKRRQVQNLFIPLKAFGRVPADHPEVLQPPRDVGRFGWPAALDEPRQRAAVALEIVAHAIQPFGLRRAEQPLRGERRLRRRNSARAPPARRRARPQR